jgi:hypothetical protein
MLQIHIATLEVDKSIPAHLEVSIKAHRGAGVFHGAVRLVILLNINTKMNFRQMTEAVWTGSAESVILLVRQVGACIPNAVQGVSDPKNSEIVFESMTYKNLVPDENDHSMAALPKLHGALRRQIRLRDSRDMMPIIGNSFLDSDKGVEQASSEIVHQRNSCQDRPLSSWAHADH